MTLGFYHYYIQELGTLEMTQVFNELCENGALKPKYTHLESKGLTHMIHMPWDFQEKWVRYILRKFHEMHL